MNNLPTLRLVASSESDICTISANLQNCTLKDCYVHNDDAWTVIIHQRRGYLGEWANADKIDLLVLLLNFRIVRRKVKLLEIDALERSDGVDEHPTSDTLP
jgi:hypothetical protein